MDLAEFKNPGKEYRPSPFWSWNDALDAEELRWQVREFADKGFGGYFMHARVGLITPYLSPEWMHCIRACLDEGRKAGLESWLYDEDKWPSGFAGGFVPAKSDRYRTRFIHMNEITTEDVPEALKEPSVLRIFEARFSSSKLMEEFRPINRPEEIRGDGRILLFRVEVIDRSNWFNGESYVDLLNPKVMEEFLEVTLGAYAGKLEEDFGEFMPGIFTDEPNYVTVARLRTEEGQLLPSLESSPIPWTDEMPGYFLRLNGYDILDRLPLLCFEGEGFRKIRYDFWRTITQRFIECFTIPYSKRCRELGLKMTGHYLLEDTFITQIYAIGAAMPHYEYMQVPGIDHIGRRTENPKVRRFGEEEKTALTLKQCSSVAHQFGRSRVLSELFGAGGQSMTFEDQKWIADFHLALGITFFCPHLTLYTMKGEAKRDFPPTFSYHQPYWEHLKILNDYFARASYLCSRGKFHGDILLLHSIGSAWATFSAISTLGPPFHPPPKDRSVPPWRYNDGLVNLQNVLLALHWGFDYGDETILSRHAHIEGKEFVVNQVRYKVVIVPPSLTWSTRTAGLLERFMDAGGKVLFVGETPSLIDGEPAEERWRRIVTHSGAFQLNDNQEVIDEALDQILPRSISAADQEGNEIDDILVHHRVDGVHHIHFLANKNRTQMYNAVIKFAANGEVTEWDMLDGSVSTVDATTQEGETVMTALFHPAGSHVFVVDTSRPSAVTDALPRKEIKEEIIRLPEEWSFNQMHLNSMVLDTCQYSLGDGKWSEKMPVWKVRREAWREAGTEKYMGLQPWVLTVKNIKPSKSFELQIRTTFKSEVKGRLVNLVVEKASLWTLSVNGRNVPTKAAKWHWDKQFGKIDISDYVRVGENLIKLSCRYNLDIPIEDFYLVGDFGVKKASETEYVLTGKPEVLRNGDWVEQGYPFYAGTMQYKTTFNLEKRPEADVRVLIRLPEAEGNIFLVSVDGERRCLSVGSR